MILFDIKKYAIHDGPGIRTTIFFKGCPLSCIWCHNPESLGKFPHWVYDSNRCTACGTCIAICPSQALEMEEETGKIIRHPTRCKSCGDCISLCPSGAGEMVGYYRSVPELLQQIEKDLPFYESSGGGVTFSGGEPLMQWKPLLELLRACRNREIHTAVDTTGHAPKEVIEKIADVTDLFLFDVKHMNSDLHQRFTGVPNALILSNLRFLSERAVSKDNIIIRMPLIPGINDDEENLTSFADFMKSLTHDHRVNILPYHEFQKSKYQKFGISYAASHLTPPAEADVKEVLTTLQKLGVDATVSTE